MRESEFKEIARAHKDDVYRYAFYMLRNREDAGDITQETFIRLWRAGKRQQIRSCKPWLLRVAHNLCLDRLRVRRFENARFSALDDRDTRVRFSEPHDADADPEVHMQHAELAAQLQKAIGTLPEHLRSVVILREIEGYSYQEISEVLEQKLNNVKVNLHRARKLLRKQLAPYLKTTSGAEE